MISSIFEFPFFDQLEVDLEQEYRPARREKLVPLQQHAIVGALKAGQNKGKWHPYFDEIVLDTTANFLSYTHKPLLIYFYEPDWGKVALGHLAQLDAAGEELKALQVNVLVVTSAAVANFQTLCRENGWALEACANRDNELARIFNIYSERNPAWNRYAGLESNIPLPALYLLNHNRAVALAFPNEVIEPELPVEAVKKTVQYAA